MTVVIPATRFKEFERLWAQKLFPNLRYGQAFYNFMDFHKMNPGVHEDVEFIYNANYLDVADWIFTRIDPLH